MRSLHQRILWCRECGLVWEEALLEEYEWIGLPCPKCGGIRVEPAPEDDPRENR